jgi:hypothetical protein
MAGTTVPDDPERLSAVIPLRRTHFAPLALAAALALTAAACGDDQDPTIGGEGTTTTAPADDRGDEGADEAGAGRSGSGELTLGDQSFPFTVDRCELDGDEIDVAGTGTGDEDYEIEVVRRTTATGSSTEAARLIFASDSVAALANIYSDDRGDPVLESDGSTVTGTGTFLATQDDLPQGEGFLDLTCD